MGHKSCFSSCSKKTPRLSVRVTLWADRTGGGGLGCSSHPGHRAPCGWCAQSSLQVPVGRASGRRGADEGLRRFSGLGAITPLSSRRDLKQEKEALLAV